MSGLLRSPALASLPWCNLGRIHSGDAAGGGTAEAERDPWLTEQHCEEPSFVFHTFCWGMRVTQAALQAGKRGKALCPRRHPEDAAQRDVGQRRRAGSCQESIRGEGKGLERAGAHSETHTHSRLQGGTGESVAPPCVPCQCGAPASVAGCEAEPFLTAVPRNLCSSCSS